MSVALCTAASTAWTSESIELRLLRLTQLGVLQDLTREELLRYTQDGNGRKPWRIASRQGTKGNG